VGGGRKRGYKGEYCAKKSVHMYIKAKMIPVETILGIG
jgi:hypothetical protein